jgi:putative transposase
MEVGKDHIHLLVETIPKISALQIVRRLKQLSSYYIWKNHPVEMKGYFWKEKTFWSNGFFACTIGNTSKETIEKYIAYQG